LKEASCRYLENANSVIESTIGKYFKGGAGLERKGKKELKHNYYLVNNNTKEGGGDLKRSSLVGYSWPEKNRAI